MKRREALKIAAAFPGAAMAQSRQTKSRPAKGTRIKKLGASNEGVEAQFLALFLAMMVSKKQGLTVAYWVDTFINSKGDWTKLQNDSYFSYSTQAAYACAYDLLVTQKLYPSVLAFQKDYRAFSQKMMSCLTKSSSQRKALDDPYPDICPYDLNITDLLGELG